MNKVSKRKVTLKILISIHNIAFFNKATLNKQVQN